MSYINAVKFYDFYQESSTTSQVISTTLTELSGSRFSYTPKNSVNKVLISFTQIFQPTPDWDTEMECKIQESTDNFVSDINDVSGSHTRIQALGPDSGATSNGADNWFFENDHLFEGWKGKKYFRVMLKSSQTTSEFTTQFTNKWNATYPNNAYPPVSITVKEI